MPSQELCRVGLIALWHMESSQTRDRTYISCNDRQILNHWTTREVLDYFKMLILCQLFTLSIRFFYSPFTKLLNKYLLSTSHVLDALLGAGDTASKQETKFPTFLELNYRKGDIH